ncbi:MAG: T9SS type A sorting domain-containing protein, partial [Saprospiraceae bacterium]|nr:T9SS type A sorting domain-containing protein [Saprospiraceae bacterium]
EGGYIAGGLTGTKNSGDVVGGHGLYDMWVVKIDLSGNLVWQLPIGGTELDKTSQMELLADGSCILIGETRSNDGDFSNNDGGADFALVKISPDGELVWQQTFGGTKPDSGYAIERTPDNGYIIGGHTWSTNGDLEGFTNRGKSDFWILKLSPETISATLDTKTEPVLLYPNPTADVVNISVPEPFSELHVVITDASGITVLQKDVINGGAVSLAGLPAGIYTFHARMPDGRVRTGRLAKY